jgi:hypothetical protein
VKNRDWSGAAKSSVIEDETQRRKRLVKNQRQRELYGVVYRRRRRQFAKRIERGEEIRCCRCGEIVGPDQPWDLDHNDFNPAVELPAHRSCNRAAPNRLQTSRKW